MNAEVHISVAQDPALGALFHLVSISDLIIKLKSRQLFVLGNIKLSGDLRTCEDATKTIYSAQVVRKVAFSAEHGYVQAIEG